MIPHDVDPARPPVAVVVRVPEVATTAADGLPQVLRAGRLRLVLPVWAAPNATATTAWITVDDVACAPASLRAGAVVRVGCATTVPPGARVTVRVVTDEHTVASWSHATR